MSTSELAEAGVARDELGRVVKGARLNPTGRPKTDGHFRELCRKRTRKALKALTDALSDPDTRVPAAKALLEFAWGKAPSAGFKSTDAASDGGSRWKPEEARALLAEIRRQRLVNEPQSDADH
jgi:hypothetical protein